MSALHTPGPWTAHAQELQRCHGKFLIVDSNSDGLSLVYESFNTEADAHLIAAAPELLEAAESALLFLDNLAESETDKYFKDERKALKAAIAKAKGEK